jgi:hypothetical protein
VIPAVPYRVIQTLDSVHQDASSRVLDGSRAKYRRWTHSLTCQTSPASPADPGGLPVGLVLRSGVLSRASVCVDVVDLGHGATRLIVWIIVGFVITIAFPSLTTRAATAAVERR